MDSNNNSNKKPTLNQGCFPFLSALEFPPETLKTMCHLTKFP